MEILRLAGSGDGSGAGYSAGGYGDGYSAGSYGDGCSGDGYSAGGDGDGYSGYGYSFAGYSNGYSGDGDAGYSYWFEVFNQNFQVDQMRISFIAFWMSDSHGRPANGGSGTVATEGLVEKIRGPLKICTPNALHATLDPPKYEGERLWLVDMRGELQFSDDKIGALERKIIGELKCP